MNGSGDSSARRSSSAPTALEWLCLAGGLVLTLQYAWLLDDAFIYYRYVDNLLFLERGLVFNPGEYVEGYSSPLWTLVLIPLRWIGCDWWLAVRLIGLASFAASWILLLALDRRLSPRGGAALNFPLLYLGFNYATLCYFTSGVEAPLVQLAAVAFALWIVAPGHELAAALAGLAPMVRHELAVPFVVAAAWAWWRTRRAPWTALTTCGASLGGWLVFRVVYYADLFPNTFYLKDEVHWARGLAYLHDTARTYGVYGLVPLFVALAVLLRAKREPLAGRERLVMLACVVPVALYVARIGGDPRHYRYLAFPFCLLACASAGLAERALARFAPRAGRIRVLVCGLLLAVGFASQYPHQLSKHPLGRDAQHTKQGEINDAQYHRLRADIGVSPWTLRDTLEELDDGELDILYDASRSPLWHPAPATIRGEYRRWLASDETTGDYPVRQIGWCFTAWYMFTHTLVHHDGLTDPVLARVSTTSWRAAHKRELHDLAPDLVAVRQAFGAGPEAFARAIDAGRAAPWIVANRASIELIARKAFNTHDPLENLRLAFTRVPRIDPDAGARE